MSQSSGEESMAAGKGRRTDNSGELGWLLQAEHLDESAHVEIHKSHGEMIGLIFHVGELSLPVLRSRPYQRVGDSVERNLFRPWVIGRATHKGRVILEGPGQPGILLKNVPHDLTDTMPIADRDLLSAAVWINGARLDFRELSEPGSRGYSYEEVVVTSVPVLEQSFQTEALRVKMEIALLSGGPVQRATLTASKGKPTEVDYCFMNMFPKGASEYYGRSCQGESLAGVVREPAQGRSTVCVSIPSTRWLATYDRVSQLGTLLYSPLFEEAKMEHILMLDRRQDSKIYHVAGGYGGIRGAEGRAKVVVSPDQPQILALFAQPIDAVPGRWKEKADEQAGQSMNKLPKLDS